jgi:hypothetical protein
MLLIVMLGSLALPVAMAQSSYPEVLHTIELAMKNAEGDVIESASAGQLVVLSATLWSTTDNDQSYVLILRYGMRQESLNFLDFQLETWKGTV